MGFHGDFFTRIDFIAYRGAAYEAYFCFLNLYHYYNIIIIFTMSINEAYFDFCNTKNEH